MKQLASDLFLYFYKFLINCLDIETESVSLEMLRLTLQPPNSVPSVLCKEPGFKWLMHCLACYCTVTLVIVQFSQHVTA